jgi:hypothetical protein
VVRFTIRAIEPSKAIGLQWNNFANRPSGVCAVFNDSYRSEFPPGLATSVTRRLKEPSRETSDQEVALIAAHEFGHAFFMATDGRDAQPHKTKNFYTGIGNPDEILAQHIGPHCKTDYQVGVRNSGTCLMFGAITGAREFCSHLTDAERVAGVVNDCRSSIRKVDISAPFDR